MAGRRRLRKRQRCALENRVSSVRRRDSAEPRAMGLPLVAPRSLCGSGLDWLVKVRDHAADVTPTVWGFSVWYGASAIPGVDRHEGAGLSGPSRTTPQFVGVPALRCVPDSGHAGTLQMQYLRLHEPGRRNKANTALHPTSVSMRLRPDTDIGGLTMRPPSMPPSMRASSQGCRTSRPF